jgi:RNA polymerase sigma factor (sigma-70 family)
MEMPILDEMMIEQDQRISEAIEREQARLRNFIRRRVPDREDAEDILQEVFYELIEACRLMKPVERVSAWLFSVARNRITDLFRKNRPESLSRPIVGFDDGDELVLEDLLPSADAGPEAEYARSILLDALEEALEELPPEQRGVFIAHEMEGRSFRELAAESGVPINTLLTRKHYAVLYLRRRLQAIYEDFVKK